MSDFIFVPINEALHWSLAIICKPGAMLPNELVQEAEQAVEGKAAEERDDSEEEEHIARWTGHKHGLVAVDATVYPEEAHHDHPQQTNLLLPVAAEERRVAQEAARRKKWREAVKIWMDQEVEMERVQRWRGRVGYRIAASVRGWRGGEAEMGAGSRRLCVGGRCRVCRPLCLS